MLWNPLNTRLGRAGIVLSVLWPIGRGIAWIVERAGDIDFLVDNRSEIVDFVTAPWFPIVLAVFGIGTVAVAAGRQRQHDGPAATKPKAQARRAGIRVAGEDSVVQDSEVHGFEEGIVVEESAARFTGTRNVVREDAATTDASPQDLSLKIGEYEWKSGLGWRTSAGQVIDEPPSSELRVMVRFDISEPVEIDDIEIMVAGRVESPKRKTVSLQVSDSRMVKFDMPFGIEEEKLYKGSIRVHVNGRWFDSPVGDFYYPTQ